MIALASHCGGFSRCGAQALGAQAQELWRMDLVALSCSAACGIFPDQGSNPFVSPALAGVFLTTVPPGKSYVTVFE